jgi:hypothetical protein
MPKILDTKQMRKELGIKKIRKKIQISGAEKEAILKLREDERSVEANKLVRKKAS